MSVRIKAIVQAIRARFAGAIQVGAGAGSDSTVGIRRSGRMLLGAAVVAGLGWWLVQHPPLRKVAPGYLGIRINQMTGATTAVRDGAVLMVPGVHELRQLSLLDQVYRPAHADNTPFQSAEGLALGADLTVRYALDPVRMVGKAATLPPDINSAVVDPAVQGVIYKVFTRYTVREIFSTKRAEIQQAIEAELKPKLWADGVVLRGITIGKITLPEDYRAGMEKLLAEELQTEKMRYTLELKEKQVRQSALEADAEKVRREKEAEAAGNEQIIAARAQEQAMQHVLPFKEKQIEQRRLEAEAEKAARIKASEGNAQARVIEAQGEAEARRKLADAEAYRQESLGKVATAQMERDGELITRHPLLIQKTMADKLSDKVSVIIAPPGEGFIGANLLAQGHGARQQPERAAATGGEQ
ncbi:SPFH domain-containing protein [Oxalobacteraceae bacterium A2-2]